MNSNLWVKNWLWSYGNSAFMRLTTRHLESVSSDTKYPTTWKLFLHISSFETTRNAFQANRWNCKGQTWKHTQINDTLEHGDTVTQMVRGGSTVPFSPGMKAKKKSLTKLNVIHIVSHSQHINSRKQMSMIIYYNIFWTSLCKNSVDFLASSPMMAKYSLLVEF